MSEVVELHRSLPAVEVHDLRKEFTRRDKKAGRFARKKRAALQDVTFTIERGECVAILGQNGSGKSTLVRHDGGRAEVFGHDVFTEPRPVRKLVNRVSVEASFFKKMSAAENLHYAARYYGMGPRETRVKIPPILTKVGFPVDRRSEPMENLSRGTHDATILLCTHDLSEAEALADRIGILDRGELLFLESVPEILKRFGVDTLEQAFFVATGREFGAEPDEDDEDREVFA